MVPRLWVEASDRDYEERRKKRSDNRARAIQARDEGRDDGTGWEKAMLEEEKEEMRGHSGSEDT